MSQWRVSPRWGPRHRENGVSPTSLKTKHEKGDRASQGDLKTAESLRSHTIEQLNGSTSVPISDAAKLNPSDIVR